MFVIIIVIFLFSLRLAFLTFFVYVWIPGVYISAHYFVTVRTKRKLIANDCGFCTAQICKTTRTTSALGGFFVSASTIYQNSEHSRKPDDTAIRYSSDGKLWGENVNGDWWKRVSDERARSPRKLTGQIYDAKNNHGPLLKQIVPPAR